MKSNDSTATPPSCVGERTHLMAGALVLAVLLGATFAGTYSCRAFERKHFASIMPMLTTGKEHDDGTATSFAAIERLKNQGTVLQERGLERTDILPLYGSSELVKHIADKASNFFQDYPSGFAVLPVGKAGATSLILLQKIAGLRDLPRGKRIAISVSPSWFFSAVPQEGPYAGNFSHQQALASLLNPRLSIALKRDLATRLERHPKTLESDPMLEFFTHHLANGSPTDRAMCLIARPLALAQHAVSVAQEHFETVFFVRLHPHRLAQNPPRNPRLLQWPSLIAAASGDAVPDEPEAPQPHAAVHSRHFASDAHFREHMQGASEWDDFALLLRGLHELGLPTLVLSMPPNGVYLEGAGVSRESLEIYASRIRSIAEQNGAQVEAFEDHEEDTAFLVDHHDHMSAKGWMYFNRALDEFYHTDSTLLAESFAKGKHKWRHRMHEETSRATTGSS